MPTSAPGSSRRSRRRPARPSRRAGFTLIELLIVIAIVAMTTTMIALSLRDGGSVALEREADRLATLLETARAESRASGLPVWWRLAAEPGVAATEAFVFVGLPASAKLPTRWLEPEVRAEIEGGSALSLGPEALIEPRRVWLSLGERRIAVATDGLSPFEPQPVEAR